MNAIFDIQTNKWDEFQWAELAKFLKYQYDDIEFIVLTSDKFIKHLDLYLKFNNIMKISRNIENKLENNVVFSDVENNGEIYVIGLTPAEILEKVKCLKSQE